MISNHIGTAANLSKPLLISPGSVTVSRPVNTTALHTGWWDTHRENNHNVRFPFHNQCEVKPYFKPLESFMYDDVLYLSGRDESRRGFR